MKRIISIMICTGLLLLSGCIFINPTTIDFGSTETTKTFTLRVIGDVEWSIDHTESWLTVEPDNGQGTDTVTVTIAIDRTELEDGSNKAVLNILTNPNLPCPDVIVTATVGEVTTSTTTSIGNGVPEPYFKQVNIVNYEYDRLVCIGGSVSATWGNGGDAGLVYVAMSVTNSGETDNHCTVFYMDKGQDRSVRFYFNVCPTTIGTAERPANQDDYEKCKNPPKVTLESPSNDSVYTIGDTIAFSGSARDTEDGTLTGSSLVWTSDLDGQIGTGTDFSKNDLSSGHHNITLITTDSQGDNGSDSVYIFIDYTERKVWEFETGGNIASSPAVSNGYVYIGSDDNKVYCLDALTGDKVWEFTTTLGSRSSSPAVSGGYVYVGGSDLHCLDAATGKDIWSYSFFDWGSSPAISDGYVYLVSLSHVVCLDALTGDKVWDSFMGSGLTVPAVSDGYVYVGSRESLDSKVYCLNAQTGVKIWEHETKAKIYSSPAVSGGYVYVGCDDGKVYCLDALTGDEKWTYQTDGSIMSSPAVEGGYVYVGSDDGSVYRLNTQTGVKDFAFYTESKVRSSPAVSEGNVYVGNNKSAVFGLDFNDRKMDWIFKTGYDVLSSPALSDGYIYVGSNDNKVYCFKATEGDTGSWPMFKYNAARTGAK